MRSTSRRALLLGGMAAWLSLIIGRRKGTAFAALPETDGASKKGTTMIKNYTVLRKRPEMTKEQFYTQWQTTLAPLFAKVPGLTKYTLYFVHTVPSPAFPVTDDPVDGIAETWWASPEAVQSAMKTPEFQAAIAEEKRLFGGNDHFTHLVLVDQEIAVV